MSKQTAVEWLVEQMINQMGIRIENTTIGVELFEQAKAMEKQQIEEAFDTACADPDRIGKEYYLETYGAEQ